MTPKRNDEGEGLERNGRPDDTAVVAQALRAAADVAEAPTDVKPDKKEEEKMSLFWRVFGGTILSIAALIVLTLFNNLSSTLSELRSDINKANEARSSAVADLRTDLTRANEARADLIRKDEFNTRMTSAWDRIQGLQQVATAQTAAQTSLKTELDGLKDRVARQGTDVDGLKKDQVAAAEAAKKDAAAQELAKERLAAVALELKAAREDLQKIRIELDKNQAYDLERRDRRDTQYKQFDEALKEVQKGLQDCREKLARLEGQYAPSVAPVVPKKAANPRPAPAAPKAVPDSPAEVAPMPAAAKPDPARGGE